MTCSSSSRYARNLVRPSALRRHSVCGRRFSKPFHTSTNPASRSTSRCRLKLPSVSAQRCFNSEKSSPSGRVTSEVMIPRRAFSCSTRSRPSYANRPESSVFLVAITCFSVLARRHALEIPVQNHRRHQLAHTKRAPDPPWPERVGTPRDPQQDDPCRVVEQRHPSAGAWQIRSRREDPDAKADGPEPWQKRHQRRAETDEAQRDDRAGKHARQELADDALRLPPRTAVVVNDVVVDDLARPHEACACRHADPIDDERERISGTEPGRLHPRGNQPDRSRRGYRQRSVAAIDFPLRDLLVNVGELAERARKVHLACIYFAIQRNGSQSGVAPWRRSSTIDRYEGLRESAPDRESAGAR